MKKKMIEDTLIDVIEAVDCCEKNLPSKDGIDRIFYMAAAYTAIKKIIEKGVEADIWKIILRN